MAVRSAGRFRSTWSALNFWRSSACSSAARLGEGTAPASHRGLALGENAQESIHREVQQQVDDERDEIRQHEPKTADRRVAQDAAERGDEGRGEHIDESLESRRLPRADG